MHILLLNLTFVGSYSYYLCFDFILVPTGSAVNIMVRPTSAETISVTWQAIPLRDQNGIITKYNITYYSSQWMHHNTIQVDGNATSTVLSTLKPYTTYNITIRAATVIGMGPASVGILATTLQAGKFILYVHDIANINQFRRVPTRKLKS